MTKDSTARRPLPEVTDENRHHWSGSADGFQVLRCDACRQWMLPPAPVCRYCRIGSPMPETVSGNAQIVSWTVNHQAWIPGMDVPFVVVVIAPAEQQDLRLLTNLVDEHGAPVRSADGLQIGTPIRLTFQQVADDVSLPQSVIAP
ncbi:Zn-ribbon domain-containing OB-fold protein [Williamsia sp. R60]